MSAELGPYVQMGKLAQQMAIHYEKDENLSLETHLAHFLDEVEVNVASDKFDHEGFVSRICASLKMAAEKTANARRREFLQALVDKLQSRLQQLNVA